MRERKNTVLLFSKLPEVGLVKTRLTTLKDGWFEPEVASALYHCMLFDVVEIICAALADLEKADAKGDVHDTYELVISTAPARNLEPMRKLFEDAGTWPREIVFINDEGANFDEHYNHAFAQAWARGADCVLSMGADMPVLTKADIREILHIQMRQLQERLAGSGVTLEFTPAFEDYMTDAGYDQNIAFFLACVHWLAESDVFRGNPPVTFRVLRSGN